MLMPSSLYLADMDDPLDFHYHVSVKLHQGSLQLTSKPVSSIINVYLADFTTALQVLKNSTEMFSEKDLYVGKVLTVHQRTFELLEADEFTYQYMENNRHVYLMADWEAALKAIQAQLQGMLPLDSTLHKTCTQKELDQNAKSLQRLPEW